MDDAGKARTPAKTSTPGRRPWEPRKTEKGKREQHQAPLVLGETKTQPVVPKLGFELEPEGRTHELR
jgi:hypothetical protein